MHYELLANGRAAAFESLTYPALRHLLALEPAVRFPAEGDRRRVQPLAVGASEEAGPVGLALGCLPLGDGDAPELLSFHLRTGGWRVPGAADDLLARFEGAVRDAGGASVGHVYTTGRAETEVLEALLTRRGWSPPETRMVSLRFTLEEISSTPWYQRYRRRTGFDFSPWSAVGEEDLADLRASHEKSPWIAEDLVPWAFHRERLDPASSIAIRLDGAIVGWVLNHRLDEETVRFTCSFLRRDLSRRARIVPAYSESIDRAKAAGFERGLFTVPKHHTEMVAFVERWCAPWFGFVGETRGVAKALA
jgi:hypothetical protein